MESIAEIIEFCKSQGAYHAKKAAWTRMTPEQAAKHKQLAEQFTGAVRFLTALPAKAPEMALDQADLFALDPFALDEFPDDLVNELAISRADQEDAQIVQLFRIARRPLNINEVMVGLFRKFQVQSKRTALSARLYRMASRGDLSNPEKGVYALPSTQELQFEKDESPP